MRFFDDISCFITHCREVMTNLWLTSCLNLFEKHIKNCMNYRKTSCFAQEIVKSALKYTWNEILSFRKKKTRWQFYGLKLRRFWEMKSGIWGNLNWKLYADNSNGSLFMMRLFLMRFWGDIASSLRKGLFVNVVRYVMREEEDPLKID